MIVYGTEIESDMVLPFNLDTHGEVKHRIELSSELPVVLRDEMRCGVPFYHTHGRSVYLYSDREIDGYEAGQPWCYEVPGVASFYWRSGETVMYYLLASEGTVEQLGFWLIHLFLPFYLSLEEKYHFFHAGAVTYRSQTLWFVAPSMGGKSTMTDYFIQQGHPLVTDDKLATCQEEDHIVTLPSHRYHRPFRAYETLGNETEVFETESRRLGTCYLLHGEKEGSGIEIEEIRGYEKFLQIEPYYFYFFPSLRHKHLHSMVRVLDSCKVYKITFPWGKERLSEVYSAIGHHQSTLSKSNR